jgi:ELWxxDGT repeat protein
MACTGPTREYYFDEGGTAGTKPRGGAPASSAGSPAAGANTQGGVIGQSGMAGAAVAGNDGEGGAAGAAAAAGNAGLAGAAGTIGTTTIAGASNAGGATNAAGMAGVSGTTAVGGTTDAGGAAGLAGSIITGGAIATAGTTNAGGTIATGGTVAAGATPSTGGTIDTGGTINAGGTISAGGISPSGGVGGYGVGGSGVAGSTGKNLGEGCGLGAECNSLNCVDGVCCVDSQCPECMNCGGLTWECTIPVLGLPDHTGKVCEGSRTCNTSGACKLLPGQGCSLDDECIDGYCTDGVCCKSRCNGTCQSCDAVGDCQIVRLREDDTCRPDATGARMCDALGTCSVPHLITDINKVATTSGGLIGTAPSSPHDFTEGPDRRVYFGANDGLYGDELWATDGTGAGTVRVSDIWLNAGNSSPRGFVNAGSNLFFSAMDNTGYVKLYATNGTPAGTRLVKDFGTSIFGNFAPRAIGANIYFQGCSAEAGCELWRSDGTSGGTVMVADVMTAVIPLSSPAQTFSSNPAELTVMGGQAYFRAADSILGLGSTNTIANYELWKSDGTVANTVRVVDIDPGFANSSPSSLAALPSVNGPRLLFAALTGGADQELYVTNGTVGDLLKIDINPGSGSSYPGPFVTVGNRAYFAAYRPTEGLELWVTDGTATGTSLVKDISTGTGNSNPSLLAAAGNFLYFRAWDGASFGVWRSDGTSSGTVPVFSAFTPVGATPYEIRAFGNRVFVATSGSGTQELWVTDGTTAGTVKTCVDRTGVCGQPFASNPWGMNVIGGRMFFTATALTTTGASWGAEPFIYP